MATFFIINLAVWKLSLGFWQDILSYPMFITHLLIIPAKGHQKYISKIEYLSLTKYLAGFDIVAFGFWMKHLKLLCYLPQTMEWEMIGDFEIQLHSDQCCFKE